jgi:hypothetical protein
MGSSGLGLDRSSESVLVLRRIKVIESLGFLIYPFSARFCASNVRGCKHLHDLCRITGMPLLSFGMATLYSVWLSLSVT